MLTQIQKYLQSNQGMTAKEHEQVNNALEHAIAAIKAEPTINYKTLLIVSTVIKWLPSIIDLIKKYFGP